MIRAVAYARYSSVGQREESIEGQMRAIKEYANSSNLTLICSYVDRGISGTRAENRTEFIKMVEDARKNKFDVIIVHKLDRFARNRTDAAIYRRELSKCGVKLISVLENFDEDSPESVILQSVIEGYNEYYSRNLRREVMKGMKENALSCRFTGGVPCLGFDIDKDTQKYVINEYEAEAVKLIFKMYLEGSGYTEIINELNKRAFKTKRGKTFGKNSLYEILRNEKYTGVYIYNKHVHPDENGKFNRHAKRDDSEIIRIEDGVPQIISKEDFEAVQKKMNARKQQTARFKAKQEYLLSGKVVCGDCGGRFAGNSRHAGGRPDMIYISYNCTKKNGKTKCSNPGIKRDVLEEIVLKQLADKVFDVRLLPEIIAKYDEFARQKNCELYTNKNHIKSKLAEIDKSINNIVDIVVSTGSAALADKLKELEAEKATLENTLTELEISLSEMSVSEKMLRTAFEKAKTMLSSGTLTNKKAIVEHYVKQIIIHKDTIDIEFNISGDYTITETIAR